MPRVSKHLKKEQALATEIEELKVNFKLVSEELKLFEEEVEVRDEGKNAFHDDHKGPTVDMETWLEETKMKVKDKKQPLPSAMFLTKIILESLCHGMTSERELKNILIEQCKMYGVRSTGRATIAGCGIDVATFCSVLYYLGILEPTTIQPSQTSSADKTEATSSSSDAGNKDVLAPAALRAILAKVLAEAAEAAQKTANSATGEGAGNEQVVCTTSSTLPTKEGKEEREGSSVGVTSIDGSSGDAMDIDSKGDTGGGSSSSEKQLSSTTTANSSPDGKSKGDKGNKGDGDDKPLSEVEAAFRQELISHGIGSKAFFETVFEKESEVFKNKDTDLLLEPFFKTYGNALMRYLQECLNRKMTHLAGGGIAAKEKKSKDKTAKAGGVALDASKADGSAMDTVSSGAHATTTKPSGDPSIPPVSTNTLSNGTSTTSGATKLNLSGAIIPIMTSNNATISSSTTTNATSAAIKNILDSLPSAATSTTSSPAGGANSSPQNVRPQKGWKVNDKMVGDGQLADPQSLLKEWTDASYEEASLLELEERILRRLAGQCNIPLHDKPYRVGTRFLSRRSFNKRKHDDDDRDIGDSSPRSNSNGEDGGNAFKDGAVFNAQSLWYKAYKARTRKRSRSVGSSSGVGISSRRAYSSAAGSMPAVHPNADSALSASTGGGSSFNYDYLAVQTWSQKKNEPSQYVSQQKQKQRNRAHSSSSIISDSHPHTDQLGPSNLWNSTQHPELAGVPEHHHAASMPLPPMRKYNNINNVNVRYLVPLAWNLSDHIVSKNDSMQLKGSLFAPIVENTGRSARAAAEAAALRGNDKAYTEATILLPDLVINTTEIPWHLLAQEFQVMNAEEMDMKDGTSSTYTSPRASSRGGSGRNSFSALSRESSLGIGEESPRSDITFSSVPNSPRGGMGGANACGSRLSSGGNKSTNSSEAFSSPRINTSFTSVHSSGGNHSYTSDKSDSIFNRNHVIRSMSMNLGVGSLKDVEVPAPVVKEVEYDLEEEVNKMTEAGSGSIDNDDNDDNSDGDEDFLDEHCGQRHTEVLRNMRQRYEKLKKLKLERKEISLAEQALNPHNHRKSSSPRARGGFVSRSPKLKSKSSSSKSKGGSSGAAVKFRPVFDTNTSTTLEPSTNMTVTVHNDGLSAVVTAMGQERPQVSQSHVLPEALSMHTDGHSHAARGRERDRSKKAQNDVNMDVSNIIQGEGMAGGYSKRERKVSTLFKDTIPSAPPVSPTRKRGRPKKFDE